MAAAKRILRLQRPGELDVDFADRIGISPQLVSNMKKEEEPQGAGLWTIYRVAKNTGTSAAELLGLPEGTALPTLKDHAFDKISAVVDEYKATLDAEAPEPAKGHPPDQEEPEPGTGTAGPGGGG